MPQELPVLFLQSLIMDDLKIPVKYIGVGEQIDDLQPFNPSDFAKALFTKDSKEE